MVAVKLFPFLVKSLSATSAPNGSKANYPDKLITENAVSASDRHTRTNYRLDQVRLASECCSLEGNWQGEDTSKKARNIPFRVVQSKWTFPEGCILSWPCAWTLRPLNPAVVQTPQACSVDLYTQFCTWVWHLKLFFISLQ